MRQKVLYNITVLYTFLFHGGTGYQFYTCFFYTHTGIEQGSKWIVDGERVYFSLLKWEVKISKGRRIERSMS